MSDAESSTSTSTSKEISRKGKHCTNRGEL
jgi:hypothetical protein